LRLSSLKAELVSASAWHTSRDAATDLAESLRFYNHQRYIRRSATAVRRNMKPHTRSPYDSSTLSTKTGQAHDE
jgi:hypothetical protein